MAGSDWYVLQVATGKEEANLELIEKIVLPEVFEECFSPKCELMKKIKGEWVSRQYHLIPGYLVVVTKDIETLDNELQKVPSFVKILKVDGEYLPLDGREVDFMKECTKRKDRTIGMSTGVIEGNEIIITEGPLRDHTGFIKKVDRQKRIAYLEIEMFGRLIKAKAGLSIVQKS